MIKKTVNYKDFNGNDVEECLYFNLNEVERTKLQVSKTGGLAEYIKEVVKSGNESEMVELLDLVILSSYGVKSEDGKRFIKSAALKEEFQQSPAYEKIFMLVATDKEESELFIKGILQ